MADLQALRNAIEEPKAGYWGASEPSSLATIAARVVRNGDAAGSRSIATNTLPLRWFNPKEVAAAALQLNDTVLVSSGEVGHASRVVGLDAEHPSIASNFVRRVRATSGHDPAWLVHLLQSPRSKRTAERFSGGTAIPNLGGDFFSRYEVWVPPLEEQVRIGEVLDTVDEAIETTERVIAKLASARVGLLREQLSPGLSESPPPGWEIVRVGRLLGRRSPAMRSGPFGSSLLASELVSEGVPLLGIDNVQREHFVADYRRFVTPDKAHELRRYRVHPRDIMITIMGTVGRCCVVPDSVGEALSSKHVWTVTLDPECYLPELACLQMNYAPWVLAHFCRDEQGGIMSAIRSETIRSLQLPTPPMAEQRRIWAVLHESTCRIEAEAASLSKLRELRSGLAADLLSGCIRTVAE